MSTDNTSTNIVNGISTGANRGLVGTETQQDQKKATTAGAKCTKGQKVVLITGCSDGGIGQHFAQSYLNSNCVVIATARKIENMNNLSGLPNCYLIPLDVCNQESVDESIRQICRIADRIDVLINNAGMPCVSPILDVSSRAVLQVLDTNVCGVLRMIKAVVPLMPPGSKIFNIGSITSVLPCVFASIYSTSKSMLVDLSNTLRPKLKLHQITLCHVYAGAIKSNFAANALKVANIPSDRSLYYDYKEIIIQRALASQSVLATPPQEFAQQLVNISLRDTCLEEFWYGRFAYTFWFLQFLPVFIVDVISKFYIGMDRVDSIVKKSKRFNKGL